MLPKILDNILTYRNLHFSKFIFLPLTIVMPIVLCWNRLHYVVRGLIKTEIISMFSILGFFYMHAPIRICNSYLVDDQIRLGFGFFFVASCLSIFWIIPVFNGQKLNNSI
jgi:hypothetical protein